MGQFDAFVASWSASGGAERANKDLFLTELCDVLEVPRPNPTTGDAVRDSYVFERDARLVHEGGTATIGKIDLFKEGCFILEAKQGSEAGAFKLGTAKRGTPAWNIAMKDAYGQALGYARAFDTPVPFLVVADIGHCFDLYAAFDKSWDYRPFPNAQTNRLFVRDLATHAGTLRHIFLDPHDLDPSRHAAKVTREIAGYLANLARKLETDGHAPDRVATFLMRCLFTMFAEDVGLLPERMFTDALEKNWIPTPSAFPGGVESLWHAMNDGGHVMIGKILKFNGGLFADPFGLPLDRQALDLLALAAECNWADVEPAIFGTLLERALDPKERHALGAHYTPRAYVERLVRPTIEDPLREDWQLVQAQVRQLVIAAGGGETAQTITLEDVATWDRVTARQEGRSRSAKKGARTAKMNEAIALLRGFHRRLCETRVLDPACGSGNFLYVTLDVFKRLEGEVLAGLAALGETQELLAADAIRVTPAQFLGIEVKRWAKEIAELVLWIGYLQWHFRAYGRTMPVPEPVLRDYKNIECRDALLACDAIELVRDENGKIVTGWDGETYKKSPVTGEDVPDESARKDTHSYRNARAAEWPAADYIVGNPPYLGVRVMRDSLDHAYVDELRKAYPAVPETSDLVMYWWHRAATAVESGGTRRFGLITTDKLSDAYSRRIVEQHLAAKPGVRLVFAIDKHPWPNDPTSAAVRVAMTVAEIATGTAQPMIGSVIDGADESDAGVVLRSVPAISAALKVASGSGTRRALKSNAGLCFQGVVPANAGFKLSQDDLTRLGLKASHLPTVVKKYIIGKDIVGTAVPRFIIDFFGLDEVTARARWPALYQIVLERVLPERKHNPRKSYRERWWLFAECRPAMRSALHGLTRFIVTPYTAVHRPFVFVPGDTVPDAMAYAIAHADAYLLGVLSSRIHHCFALDAGSALEDRPRYNSNATFFPFAFPDCSDEMRLRIRTLAESLDAHRKRQESLHSDLTITGMYNVLEKLRSGEVLTAREKVIHEHGIVSVLKQIHDDLDAAVFDAYGWPHDLTDEQILERLVALNAERAAEEQKGLVRWLRPELQNPDARKAMTQVAMTGGDEEDEGTEGAAHAAVVANWPKKLADQVASVRDLITRGSTEWSGPDVVAALKGSTEIEVVEVLDSLTALGLLVTYELPEGRRWRSAAYVGRRASG